MKDFLEKRWNITGGWVQISLIFIVFAITGSSSMIIGKYIMAFLGLSKDTSSPWIWYPCRILGIFILYQGLLLWIGFMFGQFKFFYAFEKKMWDRLLKPFRKKDV
ncbi:MAG: diacylglyceryl transferase [Cytophagales bacterium]|nr:MAG: diacylglyceryl transferase [Cytophagales bacterium]